MFIAWRFVRRLGFSALAAAFLFVANGELARGALIAASTAATALLIASTLSWWRFTFAVVDDELVVTRGVVSLERLVVPLDRVQSVSVDERLFHRPFGLVRVAVDTAGSSETELEIDALDRRRAAALRRLAADARTVARDGSTTGSLDHGAVVDSDEGELLVRRSPFELVRIGVTKLPLAGLAVLGPLLAFGDEIGLLSGVGDRLEQSADQIDEVGGGSTAVTVAIVVAVALMILAVATILRVIRELVANWDLTLRRTPTGLRRTAGLLNTTSRSTTVRRVQVVTTDDWWLQRRFGITDLTLRTFGGSNLEVPGTTPDELGSIRSLVLGPDAPPSLDRRISGWAVFVAIRTRTIIAIALGVLAWLVAGAWSLLVLAIVLLSVPTTIHRWRTRRWGLDRDGCAERRGLVWRHTGMLAVHKVQVVTVRQTLFQRRRGLATLDLTTAGGSIAVPFIGLDEAEAARDLVLHRAETDRRRVL